MLPTPFLRNVPKYCVFVLLSLSSVGMASPLIVGPISLTGSGSLSNDNAPGALGATEFTVHVSGSNGTDTVSLFTIGGAIEVTPLAFPIPYVGESLHLAPPTPASCVKQLGPTPFQSICVVIIDGITGYGDFSLGLGGGGELDVYDSFLSDRNLLAKANITNTVVIVTDVSNTGSRIAADFEVVSNVPESSTAAMGLLGLGAILGLGYRKRCATSDSPTRPGR